MAAPSIVNLVASTASGTSALSTPVSSTQAGDLAVFIASGTQTAVGTATPTCTTGGASFTAAGSAVDGSGTGRVRIWYRIIQSGDLLSGAFGATYTSWTNNGTSRLMLAVFRHANGFDSGLVLGTASHNTNAGSASASIGSVSGMARPSVACVVWGGNGQGSLQFTWDSDSAKDPYFDDGSGTDRDGPNNGTNHYSTGATACQADFKAYSTAETVDLTASAGMNNTTHCALLAVFQTKDPTQYISLGTATDTDAGVAIAAKKSRALGTAAETDTGQTINRASSTIALGTATATDAGTAIVARKTLAVTTAAETDNAQTISHGRLLALVTAEETNSGATLAAYKTSTFAVTLDTPAPGAYATRTLRAWAYTADPADVAEIRLALYQDGVEIITGDWQPITSTPTAYTLNVVGAITDYTLLEAYVSARTFSSATVRVSQIELELSSSLTTAAETVTAFPITIVRSKAIGTAAETSTANSLNLARLITLGTALESDDARPIVRYTLRDLTYTIGPAVRAWTAGPAVLARTASLP